MNVPDDVLKRLNALALQEGQPEHGAAVALMAAVRVKP